MPNGKFVYLKTFGCQMNVHDSEKMLSILAEHNYRPTEDIHRADIILLNTCSVRAKPEQKVYSALGRLERLKEKNHHLIIGVGGCVAQQEGERLLDRIGYLDLVFGTHNLHRLPDLIRDVQASRRPMCAVEFYDEVRSLDISPIPLDGEKVKSYVTIIQGCENFCSFCIVPYVRGREKSRPSENILGEIKALSKRGIREVTLLGQNVNSYGKDLSGGFTFPQLLAHINEIQGIWRIRFTTSHPKDISEELIMAFGKLEKVCKHIHLPFQSGSDRVLERMNRGYTRKQYMEKAEQLRKVCPEIGITADVMVGFPGEGEREFHDTLDLIQRVQFDNLFSFKYSPRKGTRAAHLLDQIGESTKSHRLQVLQELQKGITLKRNQALEGRYEEILVEGLSKWGEEEITGRTSSNKVVNLNGNPDLIGQLVKVRIEEGYANSLRGKII
ncbi:MAG: tRNA (N6-isopentenyl adenosine(37)-C2)-methylthiotransferase MiaB [Syntrophobacterales bacterium]|nr:MAG: tRNA (N6-isopentenyl adenosine(37)-C2)-methylthiotransferase MiaB [Syntrophobacterales bacterium]